MEGSIPPKQNPRSGTPPPPRTTNKKVMWKSIQGTFPTHDFIKEGELARSDARILARYQRYFKEVVEGTRVKSVYEILIYIKALGELDYVNEDTYLAEQRLMEVLSHLFKKRAQGITISVPEDTPVNRRERAVRMWNSVDGKIEALWKEIEPTLKKEEFQKYKEELSRHLAALIKASEEEMGRPATAGRGSSATKSTGVGTRPASAGGGYYKRRKLSKVSRTRNKVRRKKTRRKKARRKKTRRKNKKVKR
jgi:hypothetical protein